VGPVRTGPATGDAFWKIPVQARLLMLSVLGNTSVIPAVVVFAATPLVVMVTVAGRLDTDAGVKFVAVAAATVPTRTKGKKPRTRTTASTRARLRCHLII
jgi:hypothetical protein